MKLFDSYKAICNDYDFQFSIKNIVFNYLWFTNWSKISSYYTLGQTHMEFLDQIYYFWALANGFEKIHVPGWLHLFKKHSKNVSCIDSRCRNCLKKASQMETGNNQKVFQYI